MKQATVNEEEKTVTIDGKTFKIGEEIKKTISAEERFLELVKGSVRVFDFEKYPDTICFWKKDGVIIIEERKSGVTWISYDKIWRVFYNEYHYNYQQVKSLCKDILERHFNLRECTPMKNRSTDQTHWRGISI